MIDYLCRAEVGGPPRNRAAAGRNRVEREIVECAALTQSVIQLTKIIADGMTDVKTVPNAASVSEQLNLRSAHR